MFDFVSSFKFQDKKSTPKPSEESHKQKSHRWSDTFSNIKSSIIHKTNTLSSYLAPSSNISSSDTTKTSPDLDEDCFYYYNEANSDYDIGYFTMLNAKSDATPNDRQLISDGEVENDIVDKFIRVVNVEEDCPASPGFNRRNDREEIRRRLATGCDADEYYGGDRPGKKPSLQARLQSGMNLQICFMNDTMSDTESPGTETPETASVTPSPIKVKTNPEPPRPINLPNKCVKSGLSLPLNNCAMTEADFFARQARLQSEARVALAQAKDMARMQMEVERQQRQASPITEMLRTSLRKVGVHFPEERRRLSRQMLTDMNLAQLQVIVNDLHTQIEYLNEGLVKFLMERDDLHMSQDSMLVDIEDLTRYLGAKENTLKEDISQNNNVITPKPKINRIANGVKK